MWIPAGPLFHIKVNPWVVEEVHLPHFICLAGTAATGTWASQCTTPLPLPPGTSLQKVPNSLFPLRFPVFLCVPLLCFGILPPSHIFYQAFPQWSFTNSCPSPPVPPHSPFPPTDDSPRHYPRLPQGVLSSLHYGSCGWQWLLLLCSTGTGASQLHSPPGWTTLGWDAVGQTWPRQERKWNEIVHFPPGNMRSHKAWIWVLCPAVLLPRHC